MDKILKYLFISLFVIILVIAVIIGFNKGKKKRRQIIISGEAIQLDKRLSSALKDKKLLQPKPILFKLSQQVFEPFNYSLKIENMEDKLTIIDEKGDELKPDQSDRLTFDSFALNILDHDIRKEESLKKAIRFTIEKAPDEEYYKGMAEPGDENTGTEIKSRIAETNPLKNPEHQIFTN